MGLLKKQQLGFVLMQPDFVGRSLLPLRCMNFQHIFPAIVFWAITFPLDFELEPPRFSRLSILLHLPQVQVVAEELDDDPLLGRLVQG